LAAEHDVLARLHLEAAEDAHGTGDEDDVAVAQRAVEERLTGPRALERAAPIADERLEDAQSAARAQNALVVDGADDRRVRARPEVADARDRARVLVPSRDVEEQIARGVHTQPAERLRSPWSHAFQELRGVIERRPRGGLHRHVSPSARPARSAPRRTAPARPRLH